MQLLGSAPSLTPRRRVISPHRSGRIIPDDGEDQVLPHPALPGRPDADFHGAVNFALLEFSEVACNARCGRPHDYPPW